MNGEETPARELEALAAIKKIDKISNHQVNLLALFDNDGVELVQFILFLITNNLLLRTERFMLLVVFMKLVETHGLNSSLKLLWDVERETKESVLLLHDLLIHKSYLKLKELNQNEVESYVKKLQEEHPNLNPAIDEMDKKMVQTLATGQLHAYQLTHFESYEDHRMAYLDHYIHLIDVLKGVYLTRCKKAGEYSAEMMIPLPSTFEIETSNLLTPFPFSVEMVSLNPTFRVKELLVEILDDAGNADSNKLKVK